MYFVQQADSHAAQAEAAGLGFFSGNFSGNPQKSHGGRCCAPGIWLDSTECAYQRGGGAAHPSDACHPLMAVRQACPTLLCIHDVIGLAADTNGSIYAANQGFRGIHRITGSSAAVNASCRHTVASHTYDFRTISAYHGGRSQDEQNLERLVAVRRGAGAYRIKHDWYASPSCFRQCQFHAFHPIRIKRSNV